MAWSHSLNQAASRILHCSASVSLVTLCPSEAIFLQEGLALRTEFFSEATNHYLLDLSAREVQVSRPLPFVHLALIYWPYNDLRMNTASCLLLTRRRLTCDLIARCYAGAAGAVCKQDPAWNAGRDCSAHRQCASVHLVGSQGCTHDLAEGWRPPIVAATGFTSAGEDGAILHAGAIAVLTVGARTPKCILTRFDALGAQIEEVLDAAQQR